MGGIPHVGAGISIGSPSTRLEAPAPARKSRIHDERAGSPPGLYRPCRKRAARAPPARTVRLVSMMAVPSPRSPIVHGSVFEPVHRQVRALYGIARSRSSSISTPRPGRVAGMHEPVREAVSVREDRRRSSRCAACIPGCRSWAPTGRNGAPPPCVTGDRSVAPWQPVRTL